MIASLLVVMPTTLDTSRIPEDKPSVSTIVSPMSSLPTDISRVLSGQAMRPDRMQRSLLVSRVVRISRIPMSPQEISASESTGTSEREPIRPIVEWSNGECSPMLLPIFQISSLVSDNPNDHSRPICNHRFLSMLPMRGILHPVESIQSISIFLPV